MCVCVLILFLLTALGLCCRAQALGKQASVVTARGPHNCGSQALEHSPIVVVHGLSCPKACKIFMDQGSHPCPLHGQADS